MKIALCADGTVRINIEESDSYCCEDDGSVNFWPTEKQVRRLVRKLSTGAP